MTDTLPTRLRVIASKGVSVWGDLQMEAADRIEALQSEIKWITKANVEHMEARVELRAEVERLKSEREGIIQRSNEIIVDLQSRLTALEGQVSQANGMAAAWKLTHDAVLAAGAAPQPVKPRTGPILHMSLPVRGFVGGSSGGSSPPKQAETKEQT